MKSSIRSSLQRMIHPGWATRTVTAHIRVELRIFVILSVFAGCRSYEDSTGSVNNMVKAVVILAEKYPDSVEDAAYTPKEILSFLNEMLVSENVIGPENLTLTRRRILIQIPGGEVLVYPLQTRTQLIVLVEGFVKTRHPRSRYLIEFDAVKRQALIHHIGPRLRQ